MCQTVKEGKKKKKGEEDKPSSSSKAKSKAKGAAAAAGAGAKGPKLVPWDSATLALFVMMIGLSFYTVSVGAHLFVPSASAHGRLCHLCLRTVSYY